MSEAPRSDVTCRLCLPRISFFLETLTLPLAADRVRQCEPTVEIADVDFVR